MEKVLKQVLREIKPSKKEEREISSRIGKFLKRVQKAVPEAKAILGGSGRKGTWLKQAHDADIFVKFPYNKYRSRSSELSDILEKKLKAKFSINRLHGSRDYFQAMQKGFTFEIVPILDIKNAGQALNITDVSPLHAAWVKRHKQDRDEIRLTKQFFKAAGVYGAESYINGFSGYVCEILTIYYKRFKTLVEAVPKWVPKVFIDIERHYKNEKQALFHLDKSKTRSPLIIIDPVQESRNAAAAVSLEKLEKIKAYSKKFLKNPSTRFFEIKKVSMPELKRKAGKDLLFVIEALPAKGKEDVVGSKLLKVCQYIKKQVKNHGFSLLYSDWEWDKKAYFYFIIKNDTLPEIKIIKGPPKTIKQHAINFRERHKETYAEGKFLFAVEKRQHTNPKSLIKSLLNNKYIKEKVNKIELKR
ncbi:CCA tRNA nucleotidyltransferase [Candidatus Woesearchaeota archaeon]|nr:CCA tRNA nucleotidyltransferase [Candidatus Woesearchaeota archaeon]